MQVMKAFLPVTVDSLTALTSRKMAAMMTTIDNNGPRLKQVDKIAKDWNAAERKLAKIEGRYPNLLGDPLAKLPYGRLDQFEKGLIELQEAGGGVYIPFNLMRGKRRRIEEASHICGVFRENDEGAGPLPIEPTMLVATSPGKAHDWLLADEPWALGEPGTEAWKAAADEFTGMMKRMIEAHGSDPDAKDLTRVLRLPGFNNLKDPANPFLVNIVNVSGTRYGRADLVKTFPPIRSGSGGDRKRKANGAGNGRAGAAHEADAGASMGTLYDDDGSRPYTKRNELEYRSATKFIRPIGSRDEWIAKAFVYLRLRWPEAQDGGGPAFDIYHELCARSKGHEGREDCLNKWNESKKYLNERRSKEATIASVIKEAQDGGWKFPYWQEDYEEKAKLEDVDDIDVFNTQWAYIENISRFYSFKHRKLYNRTDFNNNTANLWVRPKKAKYSNDDDDSDSKPAKPKLLSDIWYRSGRRRTHNGLTFDPSQGIVTRGNKLNQFRGFPVKPKEGDVTIFKDAVLHNAGGNEAHAHTLTCFMAHIIQRPWIKMVISPYIMALIQGSLKTKLWELFGKLLGGPEEGYFYVVMARELSDRFNGWLENRLLILVDETRMNDKEKEGLISFINYLITSTHLNIEKKGADKYTIPNTVNLCFLSNSSDALAIEESNRRLFALRATEEKRPAKELIEWWENGGDAAVMHYLMNYDLSEFNAYADAPETEFKLQIIDNTRNPIQKVIYRLKDDCEGKPIRSAEQISNLIKAEDDGYHARNRNKIASELTTAGAVRFGGHKGQIQLPKRVTRSVREGRFHMDGERVLSTDPDTGLKLIEKVEVKPAEKVVAWAMADYARWKGASTKEWIEQWLHQEGAERIDGRQTDLQDE
jgi:hypothetical protein